MQSRRNAAVTRRTRAISALPNGQGWGSIFVWDNTLLKSTHITTFRGLLVQFFFLLQNFNYHRYLKNYLSISLSGSSACSFSIVMNSFLAHFFWLFRLTAHGGHQGWEGGGAGEVMCVWAAWQVGVTGGGACRWLAPLGTKGS